MKILNIITIGILMITLVSAGVIVITLEDAVIQQPEPQVIQKDRIEFKCGNNKLKFEQSSKEWTSNQIKRLVLHLCKEGEIKNIKINNMKVKMNKYGMLSTDETELMIDECEKDGYQWINNECVE